jgi:hypothetical protein
MSVIYKEELKIPKSKYQINVKLLAHRPELPGDVIPFYIVPLYPAYKAGLAGHVPVK